MRMPRPNGSAGVRASRPGPRSNFGIRDSGFIKSPFSRQRGIAVPIVEKTKVTADFAPHVLDVFAGEAEQGAPANGAGAANEWRAARHRLLRDIRQHSRAGGLQRRANQHDEREAVETAEEIGRHTSELQSLAYLVCRL